MSKVYFKEVQHFNQWWIWVIIAFCWGFWIWQFVQQIIMGIPFGDNPMSDLGVILTGIFPVAISLLFKLLTLETVVDDEGVKCRFMPFQRKYKIFRPEEIEHFEVRKYSPIKDFGGWGIRYGRNAKAFNVGGNQGLFLELKGRKNFMIGTQVPDSLRHAVGKLIKF
jgi:hypothetical protein